MSQLLAHSDLEAIRRAIEAERAAWKTYTEARSDDEALNWKMTSTKADRDAAWDARVNANSALAAVMNALNEAIDQIDIETAK